MSLKKIHDDQPKDFKFSDGNLKKAKDLIHTLALDSRDL